MRIRVPAQDRSRALGHYWSFDRILNRLPFGRTRDNCEKLRPCHDNWNRQGQSVSRYVVNRCKRAVVYLLRAAHIIKLDYLHWLWVVKVTEGRINKSQVTILADTEHGKIGRGCHKQFSVTFAFNLTILRLAAQSMKFDQRPSANKTIYEKTSEG